MVFYFRPKFSVFRTFLMEFTISLADHAGIFYFDLQFNKFVEI